MCSKQCSKGKLHQEECRVFREAGLKIKVKNLDEFDKQNSAITVLRILLQSDSGILDTLEDHDKDRMREQTGTWMLQKEIVVDFIQKARFGQLLAYW